METLCKTSERGEGSICEGELNFLKAEIGRRVIEAFEQCSDRDIACCLKMRCSDIAEITSGAQFPSAKTLISINRATGVSLHWLLTGEGMKYPAPVEQVFAMDEWEIFAAA